MKPVQLIFITQAAALIPFSAASNLTDTGSLDFDQRLNGALVLNTVEPIRQRLQDISAVIYSGQEVAIYGIALSSDGYIVTKASELANCKDTLIRIGSAKYKSHKLIGTDAANDIALIKVDAAGLKAPGAIGHAAEIGTLVVSNGSTTRNRRRARLGTVSAAHRAIPNRDQPFLGLVFTPQLAIQAVTPEGPAEKVGAKVGDKLLKVDGKPATTMEEAGALMNKKKIGDKTELTVQRGKQTVSYTITMASRRAFLADGEAEASNDDISGGYSKRRDEFPMVFQHDIPSLPVLMGGPVINLKGELIGMNIARVNRAENYTIPIKRVLECVEKLRNAAPKQ